MGCGPFGNKAIWVQNLLGTLGGPFGYNGGPFGYNGGPFGYNGGPFGYNALSPLGTTNWAFWVQITGPFGYNLYRHGRHVVGGRQ